MGQEDSKQVTLSVPNIQNTSITGNNSVTITITFIIIENTTNYSNLVTGLNHICFFQFHIVSVQR